MRISPFAVALAVLATSWAPTASAEIGALDPVPSATLLFPYFEADTAGTTRDTLLTIENASAAPQLAHVVIWSDRGVPVHDFDLYLTAHEQQTIGMRALLSGTRPASAAGSSVDGCSFPLAALGASAIADLTAALTGKHIPSVTNANLGCPGADHGDAIARGYVTVDTVSACSTNQVTAGTYWSTQLDTDNTLLGSFVITHGAGRPTYAEQAVHVEASTTDPRMDEATFYGARVDYDGSGRTDSSINYSEQEYANDVVSTARSRVPLQVIDVVLPHSEPSARCSEASRCRSAAASAWPARPSALAISASS